MHTHDACIKGPGRSRSAHCAHMAQWCHSGHMQCSGVCRQHGTASSQSAGHRLCHVDSSNSSRCRWQPPPPQSPLLAVDSSRHPEATLGNKYREKTWVHFNRRTSEGKSPQIHKEQLLCNCHSLQKECREPKQDMFERQEDILYRWQPLPTCRAKGCRRTKSQSSKCLVNPSHHLHTHIHHTLVVVSKAFATPAAAVLSAAHSWMGQLGEPQSTTHTAWQLAGTVPPS